MAFTPFWDYKPTNAIHGDSPGVYTSEKILNLGTLDKIHIKCDVIDDSLVNDKRQPLIYSFVLDKPAGYIVFCGSETIHYKNMNKSVWNTITYYSEGGDHEEVNLNGETFTFTLQMIKI